MDKSTVLKTSILSIVIPVVLLVIGTLLSFTVDPAIGGIVILLTYPTAFIMGIVLIVVVAKDASERNKNPIVFALLPFFLGFIGGLIYYFIISSEQK